MVATGTLCVDCCSSRSTPPLCLSSLIYFSCRLGHVLAESFCRRYLNSGGDYRNDEAFLATCARRIEKLRAVCAVAGLNFYVETHVDRITEVSSRHPIASVELFCCTLFLRDCRQWLWMVLSLSSSPRALADGPSRS